MNRILNAFIERKRATIFVLLLLVLYGMGAYNKIPRESNPDIDIPNIYVSTIYPGISPEDSEKLLSKPIENSLKTIKGLDQITSFSDEGVSSLVLEFKAGFDSDTAAREVRDKVAEVRSQLPKDIYEPVVKQINVSLFPVLNVILAGDLPYRTLRNIAKDLKDNIESIPEVLQADISGFAEEVIEIQIDPQHISSYALAMSDLEFVINNNNRLIIAGTFQNKTGGFVIKVPGMIEEYQELLHFPIKFDGQKLVKLQDIAGIKRTYKDPTSIARVNGKNAVVLEVVKRTGENIISTIGKVKAVVVEEAKRWPQNLNIIFSQDQSDHIIDMVDDLENNIIIAVILVTTVILFSVGAKASLLIALSIPASFLVGILLLYLNGITLNIVVLFSLILTVGMIVDDAIVVSEYADRKMIEGQTPHAAFLEAADRMFWPVFTSTLVKLVVFMPLLFWPGIIGQFMKFMPITVLVVLFNSLIYALFFLPAIGTIVGKPKHLHASTLPVIKGETLVKNIDYSQLHFLTKKYVIYLLKVLEIPKRFVFSILGLLVLVYAFFIIAGPGSMFFPDVEPDNALITVQSTDNLSVYAIDDKIAEIEEKILDMQDEIKVIYLRSGAVQGEQFPKNTIGYIQLEFVNWQHRRKAKEISKDIEQRVRDIRGVGVQILKEKKGPPSVKSIRMDVTAITQESIDKVANILADYMQKDPEFKDLEDSRAGKQIELQVTIDREKLANYQLSFADIGPAIQMITSGFKVSTYRPNDSIDEIDIVVRFPEQKRKLFDINNLIIVSKNGNTIPLSNVAKVMPGIKTTTIKRVDGKRVATLMANVIDGVLSNNKLAELRKFIASNEQIAQSDAKIKFLGEEKDQAQTASFLMNSFLLTLLLMFGIMIIQFNSIYQTCIIMSAVFLSTVGVLLGHIITWQPFGIVMSGVGVIALGGIVLNNNILFVDTYQHLRKNGVPVYDSIVFAGMERLRPILLTAATAILGLLPMVFGLTINFYSREITYDAPSSQWWRQLSSAIAGGLTFATILTLFFTPSLLLIFAKLDDIVPNRKNKNTKNG